jgi:hypothetical protein
VIFEVLVWSWIHDATLPGIINWRLIYPSRRSIHHSTCNVRVIIGHVLCIKIDHPFPLDTRGDVNVSIHPRIITFVSEFVQNHLSFMNFGPPDHLNCSPGGPDANHDKHSSPYWNFPLLFRQNKIYVAGWAFCYHSVMDFEQVHKIIQNHHTRNETCRQDNPYMIPECFRLKNIITPSGTKRPHIHQHRT